jgi:hypothetical protein
MNNPTTDATQIPRLKVKPMQAIIIAVANPANSFVLLLDAVKANARDIGKINANVLASAVGESNTKYTRLS